jgi:hypothetical protein
LPPAPGNSDPFVDPPQIFPQQKRPPHEVNPPERNPYNDLDYFESPDRSPFIVTENRAEPAGDDESGGGLPGMLRRYARQHGIDFGPMPNGAPKYLGGYGRPQGLIDKLLAVPDERTRKASDSNQQDASQQAVPERRLGRRTYRV